MINHNGKIFSPHNNNASGDFSEETFFVFRQTGNILSSNYSGDRIVRGQILALVEQEGSVQMGFHHGTTKPVLITGTGKFVPEILPGGNIQLRIKWKSLNDDIKEGNLSLVEH
ncbi:hypothetical protein QWZ08_10950 [Ferruginibacter paludis]|uniref:hypothetical protein n=1 Tax=Ferruginibacter paludis TaxID=1310417 RepID=UPI0025B5220B|nr:hypothetical protein [Ferruginibacter paludis]MDN3656147.1 hypothetical protein [Ferruginibacter paludis]